MSWLTDEDRAENRRNDEDAKRRGFASAYDEQQFNTSKPLREAVYNVQKRVTAADIATIIKAHKAGLL